MCDKNVRIRNPPEFTRPEPLVKGLEDRRAAAFTKERVGVCCQREDGVSIMRMTRNQVHLLHPFLFTPAFLHSILLSTSHSYVDTSTHKCSVAITARRVSITVA